MEYREPSARVDELAYRTIGAAIEVHRRLGPGQLESAYQRAFARELQFHQLEARRHVTIPMEYRGDIVGDYQLDFLVEEELVVELKSVEKLADVHRAQMITYLAVTNLDLGLLINFNVSRISDGIRRVVRCVPRPDLNR